MAYKQTPKYKFEAPEPGQLDDVPNDLYKGLLQVEELLDGFPITDLATGSSGELLVIQGTGHAAYKAMSGDATISSAGGLTIGSEKVTAGKIAAEAIEVAKLAANAVVTSKIADKAVLTAKLEDLAVTAAKVAKEAIETDKIKDSAVATAKLADLAVTTAKLAELAITEAKLADGAVTSRKDKPTAGTVQSTANLTLANGEWKDLTGATVSITPPVASRLDVVAIFDFENEGNGLAEGTMNIDGTRQPANALTNQLSGFHRGTHSQVFSIALSAAAHVIKMQAQRFGENVAKAYSGNSRFLYRLRAE